MGLIFGLIRRLLKLILFVVTFIAVIVLIPNLPPYAKFTGYELEPVQAKYETLDHCASLNGVNKLLNGKIHGPESFTIVKGELYTTLATGEVVKVTNGNVNIVTKLGQQCEGLWEEEKCGRPLSTKYDEKTNTLYILDAYYGIWKMDMKSEKKQLLVSPRVEIEGRRPRLLNSMALSDNGDFYWTDSSSEFDLQNGFFSTLTDPTGRLFYYSATKNQSKVLIDGLGFANGVVVSPNKEFVVVSETSKLRLTKYYINGPKKGQQEVFVSGLPGLPDNIQPIPDGSGILVGLYKAFDKDHPLLLKSIAKTPIARKFLARVLRLIEIPFEFLNQQFPNVVFAQIVYKIGHFTTGSSTLPPLSALLRIDWNGNIVKCYVNTDQSAPSISDAIVYNNLLHLGSPHSQFLGTVPVPEDLVGAFKNTAPPKVNPEKIVKKIPEQVPPPKKVEEKKTVPKQAEAKPTPKPTQAKPVESKPPKPTPSSPVKEAKPVENKPKPQVVKPAEVQPPKASKPVEPKQAKVTETKPKVEQPKAPEKPQAAKSNTIPKETKPVQNKAAPQAPPKVSDQKPKPAETKPKVEKPKAVPEHIPIKEEIPSDTAKPNKETLKVIKKSGPAEIPNPAI